MKKINTIIITALLSCNAFAATDNAEQHNSELFKESTNEAPNTLISDFSMSIHDGNGNAIVDIESNDSQEATPIAVKTELKDPELELSVARVSSLYHLQEHFCKKNPYELDYAYQLMKADMEFLMARQEKSELIKLKQILKTSFSEIESQFQQSRFKRDPESCDKQYNDLLNLAVLFLPFSEAEKARISELEIDYSEANIKELERVMTYD